MDNLGIQPPTNQLLSPGELFGQVRRLPTAPSLQSQSLATNLTEQIRTPGQLNLLSSTQGQADLQVAFVEETPSASIIQTPRLQLPARSALAVTGSQFWAQVEKLSPSEREQAIQQEILSGNVPDHLREMKPLHLNARTETGEVLHATAYVSPDYLAIGSSEDYVLVPMSPITAQAIADQTQTTLPTRQLVNVIYAQADIQLSPRPQEPGPQMTSIPYFATHDQTIQTQRTAAGAQAGDLIAGHKKDVVITPRLDQKPGAVAIYGWHQSEEKNIQPLSTIHENTYADYSHGVRLVHPTLEINGQTYRTTDILKHTDWSRLLSDEGAIQNPRAVRP